MTATAEEVEVVPGVYDIPAEMYHADPIPGGSLSSTGARTLTSQCPAKFHYDLHHPQPYKAAFDFGTAAHKLVLGDGPELVLVDAARWDTNEIKARIAEIRAEGNIPLKRPDLQRVHDMATALTNHPEAADLLHPDSGQAEQTLFWPAGDVWCRARIDWLRDNCLVDYKTARSAHPDAIQKAVQEHGYHVQEDWYRRGAAALGLFPQDVEFPFIFQEKDPPYLVTVTRLDLWRHIGHQVSEQALFLYASCRASNHWPAYSTDIAYVSPPAWLDRQYS
ncbi:PD-(D/E)XK nuclease-like domain-containing protein [Streptomyces sp. NBC_00441]|uniref:PD-(D/E)XK nuclease-like domain-containing protein n=1 Tax=Streptomyces sp. NBC_00441 TaxID=2975742 RepID=UPI002E2E1736|nr:PD-(D/E)XK nuclease-like domain-containing protein [Streptomyces sp. NBC_00441]